VLPISDDISNENVQDNHHYSTPQCGTPFWSQQGSGHESAYDVKRIGLQGEFGGIGTQFLGEQ